MSTRRPQMAYLWVPQEIILHSLFESGVSRIQGLEKYITDDVVRHGNRLNELEKKIANVYQEYASAEAMDDDALFANEDDEEEESAFVMYVVTSFALSGTDADVTVFPQGPIHGRHRRGLSGSPRARYRCRVWPFLSFNSQTSPQRQEECQGSKCCVWIISLPPILSPSYLFISIEPSRPNPHPPPPHQSRLLHLPRRVSRARLACFVAISSTASRVQDSTRSQTIPQILRRRSSARLDR